MAPPARLAIIDGKIPVSRLIAVNKPRPYLTMENRKIVTNLDQYETISTSELRYLKLRYLSTKSLEPRAIGTR